MSAGAVWAGTFPHHREASARRPWRSASSASKARAILQHIGVVGFDRIGYHGFTDLSGLAGFALGLIRESKCKGAVCEVYRTGGIVGFDNLGQLFFGFMQLVSVIVDDSHKIEAGNKGI